MSFWEPKLRVLAIISTAQSNELGPGTIPNLNTGKGCPRRDGNSGSVWPRLQQLLGEAGIWMHTENKAIGSTSAAASWCGQVKAWANNLVCTRGLLILSSGGVWKCNSVNGVAPQSTVAPTGTSDTTGADGIPWLYLGTPTGTDIAGRVQTKDDLRFDPNGYHAACAAALQAGTGYDKKIVLMSIGQGDKTLSTGRSAYAQALINSTEFYRGKADHVYIGFTCAGNTSGLEAYYQSDLLPGWQDALDHYAGDPFVRAGANWRNSLGPLTTNPGGYQLGLQPDDLHMNDYTINKAAEPWASILINSLLP